MSESRIFEQDYPFLRYMFPESWEKRIIKWVEWKNLLKGGFRIDNRKDVIPKFDRENNPILRTVEDLRSRGVIIFGDFHSPILAIPAVPFNGS